MPFQNKLALPGVFVNIRESLEEAAYRGIEEETGLTDIYLEQLYTWGDPERDPRMRIISVSYMALVHIHKIHLSKGKRTTQVSLYPVEELLAEETEIAFDHKKMIACARERIKNKTEYTDVAFAFLPEEFTLPQLTPSKRYTINLPPLIHMTLSRPQFCSAVMHMSQMHCAGLVIDGSLKKRSKRIVCSFVNSLYLSKN